MTPENKQRLRDAFDKAIARDPEGADKIIPELAKQNVLVTSRDLISQILASDGFYDAVDGIVSSGKNTFEELLNGFENMKMPMKPNIKGPKP